MTPLTALNLERKVQEVLQNFEPRAKISSVIAEPIEDRNALSFTNFFLCCRYTDTSCRRNIFTKVMIKWHM